MGIRATIYIIIDIQNNDIDIGEEEIVCTSGGSLAARDAIEFGTLIEIPHVLCKNLY